MDSSHFVCAWICMCCMCVCLLTCMCVYAHVCASVLRRIDTDNLFCSSILFTLSIQYVHLQSYHGNFKSSVLYYFRGQKRYFSPIKIVTCIFGFHHDGQALDLGLGMKVHIYHWDWNKTPTVNNNSLLGLPWVYMPY